MDRHIPKTTTRYNWIKVEKGIYQRADNYYIFFSAKKKRLIKLIGPDLLEARRALDYFKSQIKRGNVDKIIRELKEKDFTLEEAVNDYMQRSGNENRESTRQRNSGIVKHLNEYFKGCKLNEITPLLVEGYRHKRLKEDNRSPATVNKEVTLLKAALNYAVHNDKISKSPLRELKKLKIDKKYPRYLSRKEIKCLLEECPDNFRPIVETALLTGMRRGEILNLLKRNVDFSREVITVENTKTHEPRKIPMSPRLKAIIQKCYNSSKSDYLFTSGRGEPYRHIHSMFDNIMERAGIKDCRFHDLRHSAATWMVMAGIDLVTIKEVLGHSSIDTTMIYAHISNDHKRKAMDKFSDFISQADSAEDTDKKEN